MRMCDSSNQHASCDNEPRDRTPPDKKRNADDRGNEKSSLHDTHLHSIDRANNSKNRRLTPEQHVAAILVICCGLSFASVGTELPTSSFSYSISPSCSSSLPFSAGTMCSLSPLASSPRPRDSFLPIVSGRLSARYTPCPGLCMRRA